MIRDKKSIGTTLMTVAIVWPFFANADSGCLNAAKTELEQAYCKVVSGGEGAGLPSFEDFRRNDAMVQALLLKRPAERLGLALPGRNRTQGAPSTAVQQQPPPPSQPRHSAGQQADRPSAPTATPASPTRAASSSPAQSGFAAMDVSDCRLTGQGDVILCPDSRYVLASNRPKGELRPGVLDDGNRLDLPSFRGRRSDDQAVIGYLSDAYARYVPKILEIGLGGATLSFTEFHHAFHTTEAAGIDFARRSEETFQLLKADRKTLGVQSRLHDRVPAGIESCMDISPEIIVCDDVGTNWVYVRPLN